MVAMPPIRHPWRNPAVAQIVICLIAAFSSPPGAHAGPPVPDPVHRAEILETTHHVPRPRDAGTATPHDRMTSAVHDPRDDYDVRYIELDLDLTDLDREYMTGRVMIDLDCLADGLDLIALDFDGEFEIGAILVDGVESACSWDQGSLQIEMPEPAVLGGSHRVEVEYEGLPAGPRFRYDTYADEAWIWTLSQPEWARTWWPCKDRPDDKADSARVRITVPDWMTATSVGTLESLDYPVPGAAAFTWFERYPIAPYLISVTAGNFVLLDEMYEDPAGWSLPLHHYVFDDLVDKAREDFNIAPGAMRIFSEAFGPYPFLGQKYGVTLFGWPGAMEHQCNTSYGYRLVDGRHTYDWIYVHELAHMWWGNAVTCATWADIWLNEGLASWSEAYWWEQVYGPEAYREYMTGTQVVRDPSGPLYNHERWFDVNTIYNRGAWVVHMLRGALGDSLFFRALADYRELYEGSSVTTAQFQASLEASTGMSLDWFFESWVHGVDRPHYEFSHTYEPDAGPGSAGRLRMRLDQVQTSAGHFTMPVTIRVIGPGGGDFRFWNDPDSRDFVIDLPGPPEAVILDPDDWILKNVRTSGYGLPVLRTQPSPFVRSARITRSGRGTGPTEWRIVSVHGREVAHGVTPAPPPGSLRSWVWDGKGPDGRRLPSGVYFIHTSLPVDPAAPPVSGRLVLLN